MAMIFYLMLACALMLNGTGRAKMSAVDTHRAADRANIQATADSGNVVKNLQKLQNRGLMLSHHSDWASVLFPGVKPESYDKGEQIFVITDRVQSKKTQLPFEFYDLPVCKSPPFLSQFQRSRARHSRRNLGVRLQGMDLLPAPFHIKVLENTTCASHCNVTVSARSIKWLKKLVAQQYRVHLTLDQLPVLLRSTKLNYAVRGYPLGFKVAKKSSGLAQDEFFLYNHLKYVIKYQAVGDDNILITGFDVFPVSIVHSPGSCGHLHDEARASPRNDPETYLHLKVGPGSESMLFQPSYEVLWVKSSVNWVDRWDEYLIGNPDDDIHFFAVVNSLMIALLLTGATAVIMIRTLRRDIMAYNDVGTSDDAEDTGWKLLHGDVFRPPSSSPLLLSVLVGTGLQILATASVTLLASLVKLLNPVKKGHTLTAVVVVFVLCGSVSGYTSARLFKFCGGTNLKLNMLATATALPGTLVSLFTLLNVLLGFAGAATSVSLGLLLTMFSLWVFVSSPLVFIGGFIGFRRASLDVPVRTNQIARVIPTQSAWYSDPIVSMLLGGILPFGSVCIELFFIMSALWLNQLYYTMGFLMTVLLILIATCAQVGIVMDYLQLCAGDHRWWWKAFGNSASAGVYLFLYSLWFLVKRLELDGVLTVVVYVIYMTMISICFGLLCGSISFLSVLWFNKAIFGALKSD